MKKVKVLVAFHDKVTGEVHDVNDEIELTEDRIAEVTKVNPNMILVVGNAKKPRAKKK